MLNIDIFFAYSHIDVQPIQKLICYFKDAGYDIFYDRENIAPGIDIHDYIDCNIKVAKCLIAFWSVNSAQSKHVLNEARYAKEKNIFIPVFIERMNKNLLPYDFQNLHNVKLYDWNGNIHDLEFGKLLHAVVEKTGRQGKDMSSIPISPEASKLGLTLTAFKTEELLKVSEDTLQPVNLQEPEIQKKIASKNTTFSKEESKTAGKYDYQMPKDGEQLGNYRILELIATGGMANVFKVVHQELEVTRAIKILKPGFSEEAKTRLQTEAKISAHLHHNNIVQIYGFQMLNNRIPCIEMEYIDGVSLKDLLEKYNKLSIKSSLSIAWLICSALQYAQNVKFTLYSKTYDGLVHRDIKPANILFSKDGILKLADFGIALPGGVSIHTVDSHVMGTFAYLSPEQLMAEPLDQRSDLYSLVLLRYDKTCYLP